MKKTIIIILVVLVVALGAFLIFKPKPFAENDGAAGVVTLKHFSGTVGYGIPLKAGINTLKPDLKGTASYKIIANGNVYAEGVFENNEPVEVNMEKDDLYMMELTLKRVSGTITYDVVDIPQSIDDVPDIIKTDDEEKAGSESADDLTAKENVTEYLKKVYGKDVEEVEIVNLKVYSEEERAEMEVLSDYKPEDIVFSVDYKLKPKDGVDPIIFTAATGEVDEATGWIINKSNVGVLVKDADGKYTVEDFGTGF